MNQTGNLKSISRPLAKVIGRLRRRIRGLVLLESIGLLITVVAIVAWVAFLVDFLPTRFGYAELSRVGRYCAMAVAVTAGSWVLYRWLFSRLQVALKDDSLALLIERRYPDFQDGLVTAVSLPGGDQDPYFGDHELRKSTIADVEKQLPAVRLSKVVSAQPATRALGLAGIAIGSLVLAALLAPGNFQLATSRLLLTTDSLWPRQCELELVGIAVVSDTQQPFVADLQPDLKPIDNVIHVTRGSQLRVRIRARLNADNPDSVLPETCWFNYRYREGDGAAGSRRFRKSGVTQDGIQEYIFEGEPLERTMAGLVFDISGGDDRIGPYQLTLVNQPVVEQTTLTVQYPEYIRSTGELRFADRETVWTGQADYPQGTMITVNATATEPLQNVFVRIDESDFQSVSVRGDRFSFALPRLIEPTTAEFYLQDAFGLIAANPHVISITPVKDQAPVVRTRLDGIGTAVTPDALIPIAGTLEDDFGLQSAWLEIEIPGQESVVEPLNTKASAFNVLIDFRERREELGARFRLPPGDGNQLSMIVKASDRFDLSDEPNVGSGDRYSLDIVTPEELLRMLEQSEVDQRRRLEQVLRELKEVSSFLGRTSAEAKPAGIEMAEPGDQESESLPETPDQPPRIELRKLFAQRAILQVDKSSQEIEGSADAFANLKRQLINNRVAGTGREDRYEFQIVRPLQSIVADPLAASRQHLVDVETRLRLIERKSAGNTELPGQQETDDSLATLTVEQLEQELIPLVDQSAAEVNRAIVSLDEIVGRLVKYETQNELLDIVRRMIETQEALLEKTRQERQKRAFDGLLDDF